MAKIEIEKLDSDNYATWSVKLKSLLVLKDLWSAVSGDGDVKPGDDAKAHAQIALHVQDYHLGTIAKATTAVEVWEALQHLYQARSNAKRLQLKRELTTLVKDPAEALTKYVGRAKDLRDQLLAAGSNVQDDEVVLSVLAGLPKEYETIVTVLEQSDKDLQLDDIFPKLLLVEQRTAREESSGERAYYSKSGFASNNKRMSERCYYCDKRGHFISECKKKKADAAREANNSRDANRGGGFERALAMSATVNYGRPTAGWVLDSGATHHVTGNLELLRNVRTPKDIAITFGNGQRVKAERMGDVLLYLGEVEIKLCDVLYIPYAAANLFSIRSAAKHGASFSFDGNGCTIEYNGTRVGAATLGVDGTYKLYNQHGTVQATALAALVDDQAQLWHRRFAHLGYDNITKLVEENMVDGINVSPQAFKEQKTIICEPCIMAKHPKTPFPTSDKAADGEAAEPEVNQLLQLVHMDVFGPMPEPSLGGSKYGATFLDDHSKLSIVRPITFKSEVPKTVREVIQLLETQSGQRCRAIRTDNGSEYLNAELSDYLKSKGIIHQTTVPYNPEQNGAAERLNRTLMDRARAMIKGAALSARLWAEAVTTASYIRNLSPVAGKLKTPWELFFGYKPDASPLRVFGATAYAHVPKEKRHKLEDRSKRGIMIGYGENKKGYRILLEDNTIITSRDVIFDEHTEAKQVQVQEDPERVGADGVQDHDARSKSVPLATSIKLNKDEGEPLDTDKYAYSQLIGSLMYLAVCTRPDVAHAVRVLAKYLATPTTVHWSVATDVLRYLAGTKDYGITFGGGHSMTTAPMGYCDADFAGDVDTRRSTTGYIFLLNGGAISWSSRRQQTVAASTTEAEYMAAAAATKEALWLRKLLFDLRKNGDTITIKADNQGAIKLLKNPITSMRSKHIDVIYHFARERVKRKEVCFEYVKTEHMIADILTKAIPAAKHKFCRGGMGVTGSTAT